MKWCVLFKFYIDDRINQAIALRILANTCFKGSKSLEHILYISSASILK